MVGIFASGQSSGSAKPQGVLRQAGSFVSTAAVAAATAVGLPVGAIDPTMLAIETQANLTATANRQQTQPASNNPFNDYMTQKTKSDSQMQMWGLVGAMVPAVMSALSGILSAIGGSRKKDKDQE